MQKFKNADRRLLTILLIVFVQMLGASMVMPVLPLYAQRRFALAPEVITLLFSAFFAAQFIAGPYIGRLSDNYGRLPVLIVSQIGTVISFVMIALGQSVEILFLARILDGITGGNIIVARAYVTDVTPPEKRTQSLGYIFAAFGLGFIFGPALGGVLSAAFGEQIPFLMAAAAATVTVLITWFTLDETLSPEQREMSRTSKRASLNLGDIARNRPLVMILVVTFIGQFGLGLLQATFALFGEAVLFEGYDEKAVSLGVGLLLTGIGLGQFFTQAFLLQRMLRRFEDAMLTIIGTLLRAVALYGFAVITSPWLAAPGTIIFAVGSGLMMPPLQSLVTDTVADEMRGGVMGLYQSAVSLSTIFSTMLGGVLFAIDPTIPYWVSGSLFLAAVIPGVVVLRWSRDQKREIVMVSVSAD